MFLQIVIVFFIYLIFLPEFDISQIKSESVISMEHSDEKSQNIAKYKISHVRSRWQNMLNVSVNSFFELTLIFFIKPQFWSYNFSNVIQTFYPSFIIQSLFAAKLRPRTQNQVVDSTLLSSMKISYSEYNKWNSLCQPIK